MNDMTFDGQVYAIPISVMPQIIIANLDAFDKANVPYPNVNWTVDEFVEMSHKLTNKSDPSNMRVAIARNIEDQDYIRFVSIFMAAYDVKGYKEVDGTKMSNLSEDPNAITAIEKYLEVQAGNYACTLSSDDRNTMGLDGTQWDIDWTSGTAAMFPGVSAWAYAVDTKTQDVPFRQSFYPAFKGADGIGGNNQTYIAYSMYSGSKNKEAAWAYLSFMTSEYARQNATAPNPDDAAVTINPLRMDENTYRFTCYGIPPFTTEYQLTGDFALAYEGLKAAANTVVNVPFDAEQMVNLCRDVARGDKQLADALKEYDDYVNANNSIDWEAYN
jgi:ABC-type glycerol-3-phosphate transport system substrate-binding protein